MFFFPLLWSPWTIMPLQDLAFYEEAKKCSKLELKWGGTTCSSMLFWCKRWVSMCTVIERKMKWPLKIVWKKDLTLAVGRYMYAQSSLLLVPARVKFVLGELYTRCMPAVCFIFLDNGNEFQPLQSIHSPIIIIKYCRLLANWGNEQWKNDLNQS